jgi:plasmid stabilization system protein ParE
VTEYAFHPEALSDLNEIWEFIGADNLDAADRVIAEILSAIDGLVAFPGRGHRIARHGLCASSLFVIF